MSDDLFFESATELALRLRRRELTAVEVAEAFLRRIDSLNPRVNAFTVVTHDLALDTARRLDQLAARDEPLGPLHGVPVAIKDLFDLRAGVRSTFGSVPLQHHVPTETALYVQRLEDAGAVIVGKTNAPEFGHKGVTDNFVSGPTRNPFDLSRNSGGSSGVQRPPSLRAWCPWPRGPMEEVNPDPGVVVRGLRHQAVFRASGRRQPTRRLHLSQPSCRLAPSPGR